MFRSKSRQRRIDNNPLSTHVLNQTCGVLLVRLLFDMLEIGSVTLFVLQADLMRDQFNGFTFNCWEFLFFILKEEGLLDVSQFANFSSLLDGLGNLQHGIFAHSVNANVGVRIHQDRWFQAVVPIVVMGHSS